MKGINLLRVSVLRKTTLPRASLPTRLKLDFARSIPIVIRLFIRTSPVLSFGFRQLKDRTSRVSMAGGVHNIR